ncbi:MAG: response regulator transcription factor [Bacillaceae bacterium]|nr:response regulator transcription factor [Bacillaceae bacterium]
MKKVLIVDDEERMGELLSLYLEPNGYQCEPVTSGSEAMQKLNQKSFDVVLLDIMMPDMDGFQTCREIRNFSDIPIIMLTARDQKIDVIKGLKLGADDYVTKPFDEEELLVRIEAVLRRTHTPRQFTIEGLTWNEETHELSYNEKLIHLTPKEFSIIGYLLKYPNRVFSREQLIEWLWGIDSNPEGRTIDSHVRNLREKIRQSGFPIDQYLKTVWGVGYKWELKKK